MPKIKILTQSDLMKAVPLDGEVVACVENAFAALAGGKVVMPPILSLAIREANGEVDVKTAYVPGLDSFAIKVSPGFFDNPKIGLPSTSGLMMVFSARTGVLEALLLDNGYLTDMRTAAAGAVAARHCSREDSATVCIFGAGMQARLQLQALMLVRPVKRALIWARDIAKAEALAERVARENGIAAVAVADAEAAVSAADIVVTTTPATAPVLKADWLKPGQHVTAMGSDQHSKNEIEPACLARADAYVPDRQSQTAELGELRSAIAAGVMPSEKRFAELGDIITGAAKARLAPSDLTIADLTGTGVQDTAIATLALKRADQLGLGVAFDSEA
ncbi:MAG: ornithine cyclodeaminase family protein [Martelella sp.]|uniref:ectoine utilization protein EutC n=1 Tax=unclassified Martelella TaxID=2629616 RepID=UPI000C5FA0B9|nr:ectoine utilization protein EutC [Martelella sp.]MAU21835.1 ornithine cyclodeaminase family protein [Martelella sp.]|tara:strand:- start:1585 stop:2583 length:999 start_codon:yes stop_codon:yes gene_type:complete